MVLDVRRREGGREGKVVLRVWVNTVATENMLGMIGTFNFFDGAVIY